MMERQGSRKVVALALVIVFSSITRAGSAPSPVAEWIDQSEVTGDLNAWRERVARYKVPTSEEITIPVYPKAKVWFLINQAPSEGAFSSLLLVSESPAISVANWYRQNLPEYCVQRERLTTPVELLLMEKCEDGISESKLSQLIAHNYQSVSVNEMDPKKFDLLGDYRTAIEITYCRAVEGRERCK